jgi:cell division protein FtsB
MSGKRILIKNLLMLLLHFPFIFYRLSGVTSEFAKEIKQLQDNVEKLSKEKRQLEKEVENIKSNLNKTTKELNNAQEEKSNLLRRYGLCT